MTSPIGTLFSDPLPLLLDGGLGSSLIARGLKLGSCTELWNLERPEQVREVHHQFLQAGSQVIETNTFGANPPALRHHGLEGRMEALNRAGVQLAREAIAQLGPTNKNLPRYIAGNMGPSGLMCPPAGKADTHLLEQGFAQQASVLGDAGVDYIAIETMFDLREALCALRAARRVTDLPITVCMTFECPPHGVATIRGDRPAQVAEALEAAGAAAVGANCSVGSDGMITICRGFLEATDLPVIAKPNAGLPVLEAGCAHYHQTPESFAQDMAAILRLGVAAVGGCCGTDARFVAALRALIDQSASGAVG